MVLAPACVDLKVCVYSIFLLSAQHAVSGAPLHAGGGKPDGVDNLPSQPPPGIAGEELCAAPAVAATKGQCNHIAAVPSWSNLHMPMWYPVCYSGGWKQQYNLFIFRYFCYIAYSGHCMCPPQTQCSGSDQCRSGVSSSTKEPVSGYLQHCTDCKCVPRLREMKEGGVEVPTQRSTNANVESRAEPTGSARTPDLPRLATKSRHGSPRVLVMTVATHR